MGTLDTRPDPMPRLDPGAKQGSFNNHRSPMNVARGFLYGFFIGFVCWAIVLLIALWLWLRNG